MVRVTSTGFQNQPSKFYTWVVGATVPRGRISGPGDKRGSPVKAKNVLTSSELPRTPFCMTCIHTYIAAIGAKLIGGSSFLKLSDMRPGTTLALERWATWA
jgi:hypothetical protein